MRKNKLLRFHPNELKQFYIKKAKIDVLKHICKKYDIIPDVKKKKIKKAEYQELIF